MVSDAYAICVCVFFQLLYIFVVCIDSSVKGAIGSHMLIDVTGLAK